MFKYDPSRKHKQIDPQHLLRFALSANEPDIASSSYGMQRARAYAVAVKAEKGADVFVAFYFPDAGTVEYYTLPGTVALPHVEKAFERGVDFCASMGFVMEEMEVDSLTPEVERQLKEVCPLFHPSVEEYRAGAEEEEAEIELEEEAEEEEEIELSEEAEEEIELEEVAEEPEVELEEEVEEEIELREEAEAEIEKEEERGKKEEKDDTTLRGLLKKYKLIREEDED